MKTIEDLKSLVNSQEFKDLFGDYDLIGMIKDFPTEYLLMLIEDVTKELLERTKK